MSTMPMSTALRSVRPSWSFLGLLAVAVGGVAMLSMSSGQSGQAIGGMWLLILGGWLVSLCLHEFAHAFTAYRYGDHSSELRGYLTLDPLKYTHPGLSLVLPVLIILIGGIGFPGGAVYLNTAGMTPTQRSRVSLAGPTTNLILGVILLLIVRFLPESQSTGNLAAGLTFLAFLQVTAAILNLIPMPGFDGYGALEPYLSPQTRQSANKLAPFGFLVVFGLIFFVPPIAKAFFGLIYGIIGSFGVDVGLMANAYRLFLFWEFLPGAR
ncbi:MAG: site-2 protease family protein [Gordonia sp. (in: high G+C Gram-positive bacteria)]|uniref:site-2 protease family protein n=1 Tax=Gordonia sp. (in: high G+C Gram-positive bacteria) TaxID=84139 RepID=UPI003BB73C45